MHKVEIIVEAAFGAAPFAEPSSWTRLDTAGNACRGFSKRWGRRTRYSPLPPAEITAILSNGNGALDPDNPNSAYFPNVKRDTQVRFRLDTRLSDNPVNLLGLDQATFQGPNVVGWTPLRSTLAVSTERQLGPGDERSGKLVADGTGTVVIESTNIPVTAGRIYTAQGRSIAATTGRPAAMSIRWKNASGTVLSTNQSGNFASLTSRPIEARVTAAAPTNATQAQVVFIVVNTTPAAGEVHYVGRLSLAEGTRQPWTIPGGIYDLGRGYALEWDAQYGQNLKDAICTVTVHDINRIFAETKLWPSLAEHDLLDGFCGTPPAHYYVFDEGGTKLVRDQFRVAPERPGDVEEASTGKNRLRYDYRQFLSFGGGEVVSRVAVSNGVIANPAGAWAIECVFSANRTGAQSLINLTNLVELQIIIGARLEGVVEMSDGTRRSFAGGAIKPGRTHLARMSCDATGVVRLYLDNVFLGSASGNGASLDPANWGANRFIIGSENDGSFALDGDIGRVAFYDVADNASVHSAPYWAALDTPWSHTTTVGYRARFLFEEFRHRRNINGVDVAGTYPGIPASWLFIDDPSDMNVLPMDPRDRTMLEYLQSLEATESGLFKIKANGMVRFRRKGIKLGVTATTGLLSSTGATGTTPYQNVVVRRNPDILNVVQYEITGIDSSWEVRDTASVAAHGEVTHNLPSLESNSAADATSAATNALNANKVDNMRADGVQILLSDSKVGWANVMWEPGDRTHLEAVLPQYTHLAAHEVLEANLDLSPSGASYVTLAMVSD